MPSTYLPIALGAVTLKKKGAFNINLVPCPFQPPITATKRGPRFFNLDATGGYYGLAGYYRSIPCWMSCENTFRAYQAYTFTVNASGWFINDMTLPNPFAYQAQLTDVAAAPGQLCYMPINNTEATYAVQGPYSLNLTTQNAVIANNGSPSYAPTQYRKNANVSSLSFLNQKFSLTGHEFVSTGGFICAAGDITSTIQACTAPPYLLMDDNFNLNLIDMSFQKFTIKNGFTFSFYQFWADYPYPRYNSNGVNYPVAKQVFKNNFFSNPMSLGRTTYFSYGGSNSPAKVNPNNGNYIALTVVSSYSNLSIISPKVVCGNVLSSTNSGIPASMNVMTLENTLDNTALGNGASYEIIQCVGGFLLVTNTSGANYSGFFILNDLSGYYSFNINGLPANSFGSGSNTAVSEQIGVDLNGVFYVLAYPAGTFTTLYWSGPAPWTVLLSTPQVAMIGVACKGESCFPWGA